MRLYRTRSRGALAGPPSTQLRGSDCGRMRTDSGTHSGVRAWNGTRERSTQVHARLRNSVILFGKITCRHRVSTTTPWAALSTVTAKLDHPPSTHLGAN